MWTTENRARYDRRGLRYPSDLTDEEWAVISPLFPPTRRGGNKRTVDIRSVVTGVMCVLNSTFRNSRCEAQSLHESFEQREGDFHVLGL